MTSQTSGNSRSRGPRKPPATWFQNYGEYLKSPQWRMKKLLWFKTYGRWCRACNTRHQIELHHLSYDRMGKEPLSDLIALCTKCHKDLTLLWRGVRRQSKLNLREYTAIYIKKKQLEKAKKK